MLSGFGIIYRARIFGLNLLDGDRLEIRQMHHSLSFNEFCDENRCGIVRFKVMGFYIKVMIFLRRKFLEWRL